MTQLIPKDSRQRFNALKGLIGSGAFIMGPAIAGLLFQLGTPHLSLFVTAAALCGSGLITLLLPNLEREALADADIGRFSLSAVREDWKLVSTYTKRHAPIMLIYFLFSCLLVMTAVVDSLEAAFVKEQRPTPAYAKKDDVDYVPMGTWKNSMIQLLNIAGGSTPAERKRLYPLQRK